MEDKQRIRTVSRRFKRICTGLIILLPLVEAVFWIYFNQIHSQAVIGPMTPLPVRVDHDLSARSRLFAFLAGLPPMGATIFGLVKLKSLFHLYEDGLIFTELNVKCYRSLGQALIAWAGCDVVRFSLLAVALTIENPPGQRVITFGVNSGELTAVFVGLIVLLVSWVMDEARRMQEDQALII